MEQKEIKAPFSPKKQYNNFITPIDSKE
jgi:hypothetical protein